MMPILKVNMGLSQCWIVIELALRIRLTTTFSELPKKKFDQSTASVELLNTQNSIGPDPTIIYNTEAQTTEKVIKRGRWCIITFITFNLVGFYIYFIYA